MPSLTSSPPFDAIDVQDALIAALNRDPFIQATFQDSAGAFNPVLDDDPLTVSMAQNLILVFTLAGSTALSFEQFRPAPAFNPEIAGRYKRNRLRVIRLVSDR